MIFPNRSHFCSRSFTLFVLAGTWIALSEPIDAAPANDTEKVFPSPKAAILALKTAVAAQDNSGLAEIFGSDFTELMTGDKVEDANNRKKFAADIAEHCEPVQESEDKIILEIGADDWPLPIPLVEDDGKWHFDTAAGKEEIINRHVGRDELVAIGVCRAFVRAQRAYERVNPTGAAGPVYARLLKSSPGKKDGLYWPVSGSETRSPFGSLVAEAQAEGYILHKKGTGPQPFHGYYFRILTQQGEAAPGGRMSYLSEGVMTKGFALVAYPERWDRSGVMTFIVDQDGKVFQRNFGPETSEVAGALKEYNPDSKWTLVEDEGILRAASER